jgi:RNA polymerase sigma factor for flagellar operon FliA
MQTNSSAKRLTPQQAEALWRAWTTKKDKSARDQLVLAYSPMVRYLASRKVREIPSHCELDDLVSHGLVALIEAVDRFNPTKGATFEQYAWTRVAGAVIDELRRQDWAPRSTRQTGRLIERERDAFYAREGARPTEEQLATSVSFSVEELRSALRDIDRAEVSSLNTATRAADEATSVEVIDTVSSPEGEYDPEFSLFTQERMRVVRRTIAGLSERERDVLSLVHVHELPGAAIGELLGVSESRVSQILSGVRAKLAEQLRQYDASAVELAVA